MKRRGSPLVLALGAVFIALAIQNYVSGPHFSLGFDSAISVAEFALFTLGLVSLRRVRNRNKRRQIHTSEPLSIAWLAGTESRFENPGLTEIEHR